MLFKDVSVVQTIAQPQHSRIFGYIIFGVDYYYFIISEVFCCFGGNAVFAVRKPNPKDQIWQAGEKNMLEVVLMVFDFKINGR